jgi:hypothetical protein
MGFVYVFRNNSSSSLCSSGLGPLGDLAEYIAPHVSSVVSQKVRQVLDEQVGEYLQ